MQRLGYLFLLAFLWTTHVVFSKILGIHTFKEIMAVLILYLIGTSILMSLLLYIQQSRLPSFRGVGLFFIISSFVGYLLPLMIELSVMPNVPVTVFMFVGTLVSVVTLMVTWLFRLEPVRSWRVLGAVCGLMSVFLLLGNPFAEGGQWSIWYLVAFVVPLSYGLTDCYIERKWPKGLSLFQVSSGDAIVALGYALLIGAFAGTTPTLVLETAQANYWLISALIVSTMLSSLMFFSIVRTAGAVFVSFATFISLLMGMVSDWLVFDLALPDNLPYAIILLVGSLFMLHLGSSARKNEDSS